MDWLDLWDGEKGWVVATARGKWPLWGTGKLSLMKSESAVGMRARGMEGEAWGCDVTRGRAAVGKEAHSPRP